MEFVIEPLEVLYTNIELLSTVRQFDINCLIQIIYTRIRRRILQYLNVQSGYSPIKGTNKYIITFEDNGQVYKILLKKSSKRPRNPISSEAFDTPGEILKQWQGPYYDFFGHPPTPEDMGLEKVDVVNKNDELKHFSIDEPLVF